MEYAPTDRELEILKILWKFGEGSVREVHARLLAGREVHFNTIQTQLRIMDQKGLVTHQRDGRMLVYRALATREQVTDQFLQKVYDGSLGDLVCTMLSKNCLSHKDFDEIEAIVARARRLHPHLEKRNK
jgi:BlaI family penicillinase repressor